MLREADQLFKENKYEEAAINFELLVKSGGYGENPLVLFNLGRCFSEMGKHEQAIEQFEKAGQRLLTLGDDADEELVQRTFYMLGNS